MTRSIRRRDAAADGIETPGEWPADTSPLLRRVYAARGAHTHALAQPRLTQLLPPDTMGGIDAAARLLADAMAAGRHIVIAGDFDCDGATACAYPRARVAVLAYRKPAGEPTSLSELNRNLRQENAELRRTVKLARESMAAMALRMERVVRNAEREIAAARRREKRGDRDPNQVAGLSSVLPTPTDGVVLEFKPRSKNT